MRKPRQFVRGTNMEIIERPGYVKVAMHGIAGWTSVWSPDVAHLGERIRYAKEFGARIDQLRKVAR